LINDYEIIEELNRFHKSVTWGEYVLGQFYFRINTRKPKIHYGIKSGKEKELLPDSQTMLQAEHGLAMFHEYIHYLHEVSTQVGAIGFSLEFLRRAIISQGFNSNVDSCELPGVKDKIVRDKFVKTCISNGVLMGSHDLKSNMGYFNQIKGIGSENQIFYAPVADSFQELELKIPSIEYEFINNGIAYPASIKFGKFYLYEGIAYELEREYERRLNGRDRITDPLAKSEYTVLRDIARHLAPGIEKKDMLTIASLSLNYLNCGEMFIKYLEDFVKRIDNESVSEIIDSFRDETKESLHDSVEKLDEALNEVLVAVKGRYHLENAFKYLIRVYLNAYKVRCDMPDIEITYFYEGKLSELYDTIKVCDQMYLFEEGGEYLKDIFGTTLERELAEHLKVHQAWAHYVHSHKVASTEDIEQHEEIKCPFYTTCHLEYRSRHEHICKSKPWRIYEVGVNNKGRQCWYGRGVMEHKGLTTKGEV